MIKYLHIWCMALLAGASMMAHQRARSLSLQQPEPRVRNNLQMYRNIGMAVAGCTLAAVVCFVVQDAPTTLGNIVTHIDQTQAEIFRVQDSGKKFFTDIFDPTHPDAQQVIGEHVRVEAQHIQRMLTATEKTATLLKGIKTQCQHMQQSSWTIQLIMYYWCCKTLRDVEYWEYEYLAWREAIERNYYQLYKSQD